MEKQKLWTEEFLGMGCSNFLQYMTQYILLVTLPILVIEQFAAGNFEAGLAMTFFQIGTVCCRPFAGKWIDSYNKKKLMLLVTVAFLLVMMLFNVVTNLSMLLLLRLFHGIIFAIGTTLAATLAALVLPVERKGEGIGYFAVFSNLAMVVGPFLGLVMLAFGANFLFISLVVIALATFWVSNRKELPREIILPQKRSKNKLSLSNFIEKNAVPMAVIGGLVFFSYSGIIVFIPLYMKALHLETQTSIFFAVFALTIVLTRPLVGRLFDRKGADAVIYPGFVLFAVGLVVLGNAQEIAAIFIGATILGAGFGALSPAFQTLAIQSAPSMRAGVATATYFWALDISVGLGSFLLSLLVEQVGYGYMYMTTAIVIVFTAILYYTAKETM